MWTWASVFTEVVFRENPKRLSWGSMKGCSCRPLLPLSDPGRPVAVLMKSKVEETMGQGLTRLAVSLPVSQNAALRSLNTR